MCGTGRAVRFGQRLIEHAGRTPSTAVKARQTAIGMAQRAQGWRDPRDGCFMFRVGFAPGISQSARSPGQKGEDSQ